MNQLFNIDWDKSFGASNKGFLSAMRGFFIEEWQREFADSSDLDDDYFTLAECVEEKMKEFLGEPIVRPAAWRIDVDDRNWTRIHVYEYRMTDEKLIRWSRVADVDGMIVDLHLVNRLGQETVVPQHVLECCAPRAESRANASPWDPIREYLAPQRENQNASVAVFADQAAPSKITEKAAYLALKEMGVI